MSQLNNYELALLNKARKYCAYQERCQSEVRTMLYKKGVDRDLIEGIISELIVNDYLNETRFAELFVGGKFRIKSWGKIKIKQKLFEKGVSERCIEEAIRVEISDEDYIDTLRRLIDKRWEDKTDIDMNEMASMVRYLKSKGFEGELIHKEINPRMKGAK